MTQDTRQKPLRELLVKDEEWVWNKPQQEAFEEVKVALMTSSILALYDPGYETVVSADASLFGLGAVLMQRQSEGNGSMLLTFPGPCQLQSKDTHKLRRRLWPSPGHVSISQLT